MNTSGIYKIQSIIKPERVYIGSAVNMQGRKYYHLWRLRKNIHENPILQHHYNKYGESDLQFSLLLECPKEQLITREQDFIDALDPWFNICKTAGNTLGRKASKETREKQSNIKKDKHPTIETRKKMSNSMIGNRNGVGNKNALGKPGYWKNRHLSEETLIKLRKPKSEEQKERMKGNKYGLGNQNWKLRPPDSEETRKKKSMSHQGKIPWNKGLKFKVT
jgi:group I intron endonuclease